ncbi:MAG: DUF58 domain-containing protein [Verrucomicrobia bacterium]|nr:DUF58 domain-containing protein [Verrucomicrobiota bacterium]
MSSDSATLTEILNSVRRIELITRGIVRESIGGEYQSTFKGQVIDFDDFREYQPGDEVRSIDWNVTARMNIPFIKKFVEERELTVFLAVDISGSSIFGGVDRSKRELAAEVAALFAFSASQNQDKVGLLLFTDRVELYLPPRKGGTHNLRIIREILHHPATAGAGSDPSTAMTTLVNNLRRRSLVVLISDFLFDDVPNPLRTASIKHDLVAVQIVDPREEALPDAGRLLLEDPETGEQIVVNTARKPVRDAYAKRRLEWQEALDGSLRALAIDKILVRSGENYLPGIQAFFKNRKAVVH